MKKNSWLKVFVLSLLFIVIAAGSAIAASWGSELDSSALDISINTILSKGVYWSSSKSDMITENYIVYENSSSILPVVAYGNKLYGRSSINSIAEYLEGQGYTIVAGINGDFFNMSTGIPMGVVITDGVVRSSDNARWAVGFYDDGTAIIGKPSIKINLNCAEGNITISHINKEVNTASGAVLYTPDYSATTRTTDSTVYAVLSVSSGTTKIGDTITATVDSVTTSSTPLSIESGKMILATSANTPYYNVKNQILALQPGEEVTITTSCASGWDTVSYAVGADVKLLTGGSIVCDSSTSTAPHTALGIKSDGTLVLYTVDGRQSGYSAGATLTEVATRLKELGCVEAVNLDGGGSTAVGAYYPGYSAISTVNKPSDGSLRSCANFIFLVNKTTASSTVAKLFLYPYDIVMLSGATLSYTTTATDKNYHAVSVPSNLSYSLSADELGSISTDGVFTAGDYTGSGTVKVASGSSSGKATVSVVQTPQSIVLYNQDTSTKLAGTLNLTGGSCIDLKANAYYNKLLLLANDKCFDWSVSGGIGTINEKGEFVASSFITSGSGTITASAGGTSATISVTVSNSVKDSSMSVLEDFEDNDSILFDSAVSINTDKTKVKYGEQSAAIVYNYNSVNSMSIDSDITINSSVDALHFWLYGDNSQQNISLTGTVDGVQQTIAAGTVDFSGWSLISVQLPANTTAINSINFSAGSADSGILYIDQIMATSGYYIDKAPPTITIDISGINLSATINDGIDQSISSNNISVTYDGQEINFAYSNGSLTATLPTADGLQHRVRVTAKDKTGNIATTAYAISATTTTATPFSDMSGHWAGSYADYLYNLNIISGYNSNGSLIYAPNSYMTREQFAVIIANWLDLSVENYSGVSLPFKDKTAISNWALNAVKAVYSEGIITGSGSSGNLSFNPGSSISRQEAMTVLGRIQACGYLQAQLSFDDSDDVAVWAEPYICTLVKQGVVNGNNENMLLPNDKVTRAEAAKMIYSLI